MKQKEIVSFFELQVNQKSTLNVLEVKEWLNEVIGILIPERSEKSFDNLPDFESHIKKLESKLKGFLHQEDYPKDLSHQFFTQLPIIKGCLDKDLQAFYEGDPAAQNLLQIKRSYPGFYAVTTHRIAHVLINYKVNNIARLISELAHEKTGIDIHPGAKIGRSFCIDHGTGLVIGETTTIGDNVKIYQGVTLGALSVNKEDASSKRHPTIEDGVVIYAGATILGGKTVIGRNSIVGGNVWLTKSVEENSQVYYQAEMGKLNSKLDKIIIR